MPLTRLLKLPIVRKSPKDNSFGTRVIDSINSYNHHQNESETNIDDKQDNIFHEESTIVEQTFNSFEERISLQQLNVETHKAILQTQKIHIQRALNSLKQLPQGDDFGSKVIRDININQAKFNLKSILKSDFSYLSSLNSEELKEIEFSIASSGSKIKIFEMLPSEAIDHAKNFSSMREYLTTLSETISQTNSFASTVERIKENEGYAR